MKATFRKATAEDDENWAALRFELWPECSLELHALEVEQLRAGKGTVAVAEINRELVGFAEVSIRVDHVEGATSVPVPYLEGWYVKKAFRGHGLGRGLLSMVENWALAAGYRELASDAEVGNALGIQYHQQLGFSEAGRSVHFVKKLKRTDLNNQMLP